jgi:hypothetical protein
MTATDPEAIHKCTFELNEATQHLAELIMNRTVRMALAGKSVDQI